MIHCDIILPFTLRYSKLSLSCRFPDRNCVSCITLGFFSPSPRQDRLWGPLSLLSNGYQGLLLWG